MDFLKFLLISALFGLFLSGSAFAATASVATSGDNFVHMLSSAEQDYYDKSFSYAMDTLPPEQVYEWRTNSADGKIRAGKYFNNQSGGKCRTFSEIYRIGEQEGEIIGYGCKRDGRDGWCKLREGNMMSCALESPNNTLERVVEAVHDAQNKETSTERRAADYKHNKESSFWSWWPF